MHTDEKPDPLVDLGYEQKDIAPKLVFRASMIFFGFAIGSWAIGYFALHMLGYLDTVPNVNSLMSTKTPADPNPIIQTNVTAKSDIRDLRQRENQTLATSGKSTYTDGFNRIPIEQAIKLTADRHGKVDVADQPEYTGAAVQKPASNAPQKPTDSKPNVGATGGAHKP